MTYNGLSNAAYHVSLNGTGAELEEGSAIPGPGRSAPSTGPAPVILSDRSGPHFSKRSYAYVGRLR